MAACQNVVHHYLVPFVHRETAQQSPRWVLWVRREPKICPTYGSDTSPDQGLGPLERRWQVGQTARWGSGVLAGAAGVEPWRRNREGAAPQVGYVIQLPSWGIAGSPHAGRHAEIHPGPGADTGAAWRCLLCPGGQLRVRCTAARPRSEKPRSRTVRDLFPRASSHRPGPSSTDSGCGDLKLLGAVVVSENPHPTSGGRKKQCSTTLVLVSLQPLHVPCVPPPCRSSGLDGPSHRLPKPSEPVGQRVTSAQVHSCAPPWRNSAWAGSPGLPRYGTRG
jgi:hypothetical protein